MLAGGAPVLPDSMVVNGQLVAMRQSDAYAPIVFGPTLRGGVTPVPNVPVNAYGPTGGAVLTGSGNPASAGVQAASASPWSPVASPLPWVVLALVIGLLGLRYIHWEF